MNRDTLILNLRDGLPVGSGDVTAALPLSSSDVEAQLRAAGCEPVGRRGLDYLWKADDVLVHAFRVEPVQFRSGGNATEAAA